ncbi:MAG: HAMP domain-containing histidine kinase [Chitinophagales bacterium]|nr:HAMP domain-containing histidine kinase [Chitinophagales bacterium]
MLKRLLLYLGVMGILMALVATLAQLDDDSALLQQHAAEISKYSENSWKSAKDWASANRTLLERGVPGIDPGSPLSAIVQEDYTVLCFKGDSISFWSNTKAIPNAGTLQQLTQQAGPLLLDLPAGRYAAWSEDFGSQRLAILVPLRWGWDEGYDENARYFPADAAISAAAQISVTPTDYPITVQGKTLAWLDQNGPLRSRWTGWVQLGALLLCLLVLLMALGKVFEFIESRLSSPRAAFAVNLAVLALVIALHRFSGFVYEQLNGLPVFGEAMSGSHWAGRSAGEWFFSMLLALGGGLALQTRSKAQEESRKFETGGSVTAYLLIMAMVLIGTRAMQFLVFDSGIAFDLDNILNLDAPALLLLVSLLIWMAATFWISRKLVLMVRNMALPLNKRLIAIGIAFVLFIGISFSKDLSGALPLTLLIALLFVLSQDAAVHWETNGFAWVMLWMLLSAGFLSQILYNFKSQKSAETRQALASALATARDEGLAEKRLPDLLRVFQADSQQLGIMLKPWPFKASAETLQAWAEQKIFSQNYLFQHYRTGIFAFDRENNPLLQGQTQSYQWVVQENWERGQAIEGTPDARTFIGADGKLRYMLRLRAYRMGDFSQPATAYCFLQQEFPKNTRVYARLFFNTPYKKLSALSEYDYAVQRDGKLLAEQGAINVAPLVNVAKNGETVSIDDATENDGRIYTISKSADGRTLAVVSGLGNSILKRIYLFSLLFMGASLLLFLLTALNTLLRFMPSDSGLSLSGRGTLEQRIHYRNVLLLGGAFLIIGFMTYRQFAGSAQKTERSETDYRAGALLANLKANAVNSAAGADSLSSTLTQSLAGMAASLSIDANFFTPDGDLRYTTQPDLHRIGVLASKMNPQALFELRNNIQAETIAEDYAGGYPYLTKYFAVRNGNNKLLGALGVPYDLSERKPGPEVSDFIGTMASLYVFLLLIAYVVTFLLARSIIKPLRLVSERIRELQLDDKNEPLQYSGDAKDEVGGLIEEYNRMVGKLEDSKVRMIKLEREGAWREMARQVAHDIKNPLTTMKLSMQQLERVSSNPEQAAAYLRKAITRLIEQIDSLAQIASEFSMFANLDIRQKSDMVINEVVESVYDLFSEQRNVSLKLDIPTDRYHIQGDKNHLIRVFNNLVINAIQAIPSDRKGEIEVSLEYRGKEAVVRIRDNGGGIPPEIRDRVFEPNFTTKTSGSGLGLAICRKIIEAHDGTIRFETRENEGTDFFVEMPVTHVD